jgi:hypothetical protein
LKAPGYSSLPACAKMEAYLDWLSKWNQWLGYRVGRACPVIVSFINVH